MNDDVTPINLDERSFTPFVLILVILSVIILIFFIYLVLNEDMHSGEIIGIISFIATLFAIYFAYRASQKTSRKLDKISWAINKIKNISSQFKVKFTKKEYKENIKNQVVLAKSIEQILKNFGIPYAPEYRISIKGTIIRPDFVIFIKNKRIPIELKIYPKRIALPISKQRIDIIKNQMKRYMDALIVSESILIIWNPEITPRAKEKLERIDNKIIHLVNNEKIEEIERKLEDLLMAYKI